MLSRLTYPRSFVSRLAACGIAGILAVSSAASFAQNSADALVTPRITQAINPDQRITLKGNVNPQLKKAMDQGAIDGSMSTGRIMLVLKRSDAQEIALKQYLSDLQNPGSPNYRKWLTPAEYGKRYGISDTDLSTVTAWLQSQGFTVDKVPQARNVVVFSGNVTQVQQAFHTSIHKYLVRGETHFANATDPQIPAALAPVVAGVANLNDFHPHTRIIKGPKGHYDPATKSIKPDLTLFSNNTPILFVNPADAATIYNTPNSALNANYSKISPAPAKSLDGSGVTIGIVGDANVNLTDIQNYRSAFLNNLGSPNAVNVIVDGNDPGINGDSGEALLDTELAGGIAPGAKINFYTAADTDLQSGLFLAIYRALDDNAVDILNVSFGGCEAFQGSSGNQQVYAAWEQAAAQGISVTVSSGDSGAAGCDDSNSETTAVNGLQVSGLSTTPYNIAVGGTDYDVLVNSLSDFEKYVSTSSIGTPQSYYRTALSYIPENPWNNSTTNNTTISANQPTQDENGNTNIVGAGGGQSSCVEPVEDGNGYITCQTDSSTGLTGWALPSFQANATKNKMRSVPDVSFLAANGFYGVTWAVCADSDIIPNSDGSTSVDCQNTNGVLADNFSIQGIGGTSAAAPAFAGMLALVSQSQGNVRLGQADYVLYNLAQTAPSVFHDVTVGNNSVVCTANSPNCGTNDFLTGYAAATGYDTASGLGSVDVAQLVAHWKDVKFNPTSTTLEVGTSQSSLGTGALHITHGQTVYFKVGVTGTGTVAGDVAITTTSDLPSAGGLGIVTLTNGTATFDTNTLPGGTYTLSARYGGDATNAASTSSGITVTVDGESSTTSLTVNTYDALTGSSYVTFPGNNTSVPYGYYGFAIAQPYGNKSETNSDGSISPDGIPTGTVEFDDNGSKLTTASIASNGAATYSNYQIASQSFSVGQHSLVAKYSGDSSLNPSTSQAVTFTVIKGNTGVQVSGSQKNSSSNVDLVAIVAASDSLGLPPGGAVTFSVGGTALGSVSSPQQTGYVTTQSGAETVASEYTLSVPPSMAGFVNGTNSIAVSYPGDNNYTASSGNANVTVSGAGGGNTASFTLSGSSTLTVHAGATSGNTVAVSVKPVNGFSGSVSLKCAVTSQPQNAVSIPTCNLSPASVSISSGSTSAVTSTLTVNTTAATTSALSFPLKKVFAAAGGSMLACVLIFSIPARRKAWRTILGVAVFTIVISAAIGCGGGSTSSGNGNGGGSGTTAGNYTITVTGSSGSLAASSTVTVTVN